MAIKARVFFIVAGAVALSACFASTDIRKEETVEFLTRDGCKNTTQMLENLRTAISRGKVPAQFTLIDQGTLSPEDPRNGYPTPTILMNGRDIFGMSIPQPPFPEPA